MRREKQKPFVITWRALIGRSSNHGSERFFLKLFQFVVVYDCIDDVLLLKPSLLR